MDQYLKVGIAPLRMFCPLIVNFISDVLHNKLEQDVTQ